jgi:hypothetical protein
VEGRIDKSKEYPLILRKDVIKLVKQNTKLTQYWFRIPVFGRRGGIWVPIKPHEEIEPSEWNIRESKVIRMGKNGIFI